QGVSRPTVSLLGPAFRHETQNFARFAFGDDLKRPATDFTIRGEALRRDAGVDDQLKALAAERAVNVRGDFHRTIGLTAKRQAGKINFQTAATRRKNTLRRRRSACKMIVDYFSFSMPSNSTSNTSVAFVPMTGSGMTSP